MWEWFSNNEGWIIIASILIFLFFFSFRQIIRASAIKTGTAKPNQALNRAISLVFWTMSSLVLVVLIIALSSDFLAQNDANASQIPETVQTWLTEHGISILAIIVISYLIYWFLKAVMPEIIERAVKARGIGDEIELSKRSQTLSRIIVSTFGVILTIAAILMVLTEAGWDITPLLAGAGVAGIAIGFGAQSLVRDILNGLFIILEDQYRKGDVVKIAGLSGLVEDVNLRRTVLRDRDGIVHVIPNGQVTTASNYTKEWSRVNLNILVDYSADIDHVMTVINQVGQELAQDDVFGPMIIGAPRAVWVDNLTDLGVEIKILSETKPLKQWDVSGELRKRLKKAFDKEGIKIKGSA